jgi:serine/threonine-protein kinase
VADDVTALLFQIIKMDPHPLAPNVPGLSPAVETELRHALSKRPVDRFPTIRAFSRAFASAASGRPAEATPAPFLLSSLSPASANIEHGEAQAANMLGTPLAARTPPDESAPQAALPSVGHNTVSVRRWRGIKPVHAIVAAAAALLLLGTLLLLRSKPLPNPASTNDSVSAPVIIEPIQPPAAPPVVNQEPSQVQPALVEPEPPRTKPAKAAKPPSPASRERAKHPTAPSHRPKATRQLIRDL